MPDKKISELVDGGAPQNTDEFVVARAGDNNKLAWSSLAAAATEGNVALTISGNTAGAGALVSSGTLSLAGGNNITLSQAGNAITISGANAGGAQTAISGLANSEATYTSGTVELVEAGAITIASNAGQQFVFSVDPQSVQPETQTFIGGISASNALYTSGTVRFTGSQAVTVRSGTGQLVVIDAPAQSVQPETQTFIAGISASDTLYTSGNVRFTGVGGGVTVSSNTGQRVDISVAAPVAATNLSIGVSTGGNTSGNTTVNTGSRFVIVGSNGITASQGTAAGATTVTLSGITQSVQTQGILSAGVSTGGNTSGNTGVNTGSRLVIVGSNGITASQGTAAGATTITLSGVTQSVQTNDIPRLGVSTGGNTSGDTTVNSGTRFVLVGTNGITLSQGTAASATTVTISGVTQTVQTQGVLSVGASNLGNTAGNTTVNTGSRLVFVGTNMVSLSQTTGAGATTLSFNATQSAQTQGIINAGVSNVGNTSGDTGVNSGTRLVFAGGNNITLSQGTAANATTITISAGAGGAGLSAGLSNVGNTSGDTGLASQRLVLAGGNNITLSGSTNGGSMTITVSAPNLGAGAMSAGASNLGNTAGSTGITGTQLVLVGTGPVSLSQSTGANGGTLSINAPATSSLSGSGLVQISVNGSTVSIGVPGQTHSYFDPNGAGSKVVGVFPGNATLAMQPWPVDVPYVHDRVMYPIQYSQATNSTLTVTVSGWFGLYTSNVSTLSMLSSASGTFSINGSGTASSANNSGLRYLTFPWTNTVNPGMYWLAAVSRTTTAGNNASLSNVAINYGLSNSAWSGVMGVAANSSVQMRPGLGTFTVTTAGIPNSIAFSHIIGSSSAAHRAPWVWFISQTV